MKHNFLFYLIILLVSLSFTELNAAKVDTLMTHSQSMQKEIKVVVITPDTYNANKQYPVMYLLHGHSGSYANWGGSEEAKIIADRHEMIVVTPDGGYHSWYFDSPMDSTSKYETYITKELVSWVDSNYKTIAKREGRAITGLSMGGHGGLYLAFRNQDVYGACGSMSGGVDIRPFPNNWNISKLLGTQREYPENWEKNTVVNLLYLLTPGSLNIIIDCGIDDFFYEVNERLHQELLYRNIPHDYISRPGSHTWEYWKNAVQFQSFYFSNYFTKAQNVKSNN